MKTGTVKDFRLALKKGIEKNSYKSWLSNMGVDFTFVDGQKRLAMVFNKTFQASQVRERFSQTIETTALVIFGNNVLVDYQVDPDFVMQEEPDIAVLPEIIQKSLFIPDIAELAIRDDINLMEIAPFTLNASTETRNQIVYTNISGLNISITALDDENGKNHGLPTAKDYDVILMMQGCTAMAANDYHKAMDIYEEEAEAGKKPKRPEPVGAYFEPYVLDILEFCKIKKGGKQYDEILDTFRRLDNTKISISRSTTNRRRVGSYNLIDGWEVTSSTKTGKVQKIKVGIPSWTHSLIVSTRRPAILKLDPAFMDLRSPILRALYRICRLKGSQQGFEMPFREVYERMGAASSQAAFVKSFNSAFKPYKNKLFFQWKITVEGIRDARMLVVELVENDAGQIDNP